MTEVARRVYQAADDEVGPRVCRTQSYVLEPMSRSIWQNASSAGSVHKPGFRRSEAQPSGGVSEVTRCRDTVYDGESGTNVAYNGGGSIL
jgi:hypothetical protein